MTLPLLLLLAGAALARPVALGGRLSSPRIETALLLTGGEGLPLSSLPRLGVAVSASDTALTLSYGALSLSYAPASHWSAQARASVPLPVAAALAALPAPELQGSSRVVALAVLRTLGLPLLADTPDLLDIGLPALSPPSALTPTPPALPNPALPNPALPNPALPNPALASPAPASPAPASPAPASPAPKSQAQLNPASINLAPLDTVQASPLTAPVAPVPPVPSSPSVAEVAPSVHLTDIRSSRTLKRNIQLQRVVLELDAPAGYSVQRDAGGLTLTLAGVASTSQTQRLDSGDLLEVAADASGSSVRLTTHAAASEVFALSDPARVVVDTTSNLDAGVPPPIDEAHLPDGVTLKRWGGLSLLSFDARYVPRVVSAPLGRASGVAELVAGLGGVAGVNGGYFDPASSLPVDLVVRGGLMLSPSLERRAALGLDAQGTPLLGYPKPRYLLSAPGLHLSVNTVGTRPNPQWVTAFVGDGHSAVGGDGLNTLILQGGLNNPASSVLRAQTGRSVPAPGEFAVSFDPARFPQLALSAGSPLSYSLNWQAAGWDGVQEALAAGPLLVAGGRVVTDAAREGFDTSGGIWRATRQVAFVQMSGGNGPDRSGIAFLDNGTPDDFARALAAAGVSSALRLDSGSSATVYVTGGYLNAGGYLNTVWSRSVPNALVFVPREQVTREPGLGHRR